MYGPGTASCNGLVYEASGYSFSTAGVVNQFKSFNPATNTWTALLPVPTPVLMASLVCDSVGGRLFLFGGSSDPVAGTVVNLNQVYTIASNTWAAGPVMPAVRAFMSSGVLPNGMIHLIAGYSTGNISPAFNTNWQYNPVTGVYTVKAVLPATLGGAGTAVSGGKIYVMGGRTDLNAIVNTNYEYDPVADTWATKAPLTTAVNVPGATALGGSAACNGDIIVAGGGNPFEGNEAFPSSARAIQTTAITQLYDVATNTWAAGPSLLGPRSFTTATQAVDNLIIVGGYTGTTTTAAVDRIAGPPLPVNLSGFTVQ
jgi:N-acetylneuraminic acid mutarotase